MMTQTDLFARVEENTESEDINHELDKTLALAEPIAVPCGFRNRHNAPCQRLGNWPVMSDGKQMVCRDRPMVHCDPACFKGDALAIIIEHDDDVAWDDQDFEYDNNG